MDPSGSPHDRDSSPGVDRVQAAEAVAALRKVLGSDAFAGSLRSREFLAYVVSELLAGRADALHERTVARYALGLGDDFDGRESAVARVRATRVRRALAEYYATEGRDDRVRIGLPRGTYCPKVTHAGPVVTPAAGSMDPATVAVVHVDPYEDPAGPAGLCAHAVADELALLPGLTVALTTRRHASDAGPLGEELGVRFVLRCASTRPGSPTRVRLQLTDTVQSRLVWSSEADVDLADPTGAPLQRWSTEVAAHLGDYAGVVLRHVQAGDGPTQDVETSARLAFYRHIIQGHIPSMVSARTALEDAVGRGSNATDLHAMLAFILAVLLINGPPLEDPDGDRDRARREAEAALDRDPTMVLAHLSLAVVALGEKQYDEARRRARHAAELSPSHPSHLFTAGGVLAGAGEWEEGAELMRRSFELNPLHPAYQHANLAIERLLARDFPAALGEASIVDEGGGLWGPFCRAVALQGLGHEDQARTEMGAALVLEPALLEAPEAVLGEIGFTPTS